jgi:hypothetical protein
VDRYRLVGEIRALAFSPEGRTLASSGEDDKVILWEVATGQKRLELSGHRRCVRALAFAPDGRRLASGGAEGTVLVWDVFGLAGTRRPAEDLTALWADLADQDAARAYRALGLLAGSSRAAKLVADSLPPAQAVDPRRLARLIDDLESKHFATRARAARELEAVGELALPALRKAKAAASLDARRRIERLLDRWNEGRLPPQALRALRAVELLERVGGDEARRVLSSLARGAPQALLTREVRAALERRSRHP